MDKHDTVAYILNKLEDGYDDGFNIDVSSVLAELYDLAYRNGEVQGYKKGLEDGWDAAVDTIKAAQIIRED